MITKIYECEIKYQLNTEMNLTKGKTKPIIKLNSQLTQYLRMKQKLI